MSKEATEDASLGMGPHGVPMNPNLRNLSSSNLDQMAENPAPGEESSRLSRTMPRHDVYMSGQLWMSSFQIIRILIIPTPIFYRLGMTTQGGYLAAPAPAQEYAPQQQQQQIANDQYPEPQSYDTTNYGQQSTNPFGNNAAHDQVGKE